MTEKELIDKLNELRSLSAENEVVEFKEAKNSYDFSKLGKYFSALCNEANLKNADCAWLVFGIKDKEHTIVGSKFRRNRADLDKVQKRKKLTDGEIKNLKDFGLIEGRKPNYIISAKTAASLSNNELKAQYIKNRGLDDEHYKKLILEYLKKFGKSPRKNIETFLRDKLPDILTETQKKNKVTNLLSSLRISGKIQNSGYSEWSIV